ncbi:hypothetical protein DV737_g5779, partial [Chaetothyriales sp. CBS 132003]
MARRPRLAAQAAAASMRSAPPLAVLLQRRRSRLPNFSDNEDEEMADAPATDAPTPQEDEEAAAEQDDGDGDGDGDEDEQNDGEEDDTPQQSPPPSRSGTPRRGRGRGRARGKARARSGRASRREAGASDDETNELASDTATPKRRGGFRGGRGGGRWAKYKANLSRQTAPPVDDEGNVMEIVNDEVLLPDDPEGINKVDENGCLQHGREYRVRTFTILGRGKRLYMLSTEPARCIGFRDSYLFFQKHKHLYKILIDDDEKRDLIERDLMPNSYKGRQIGVVTARSVYREFGAKIVIGGKKVIDDYYAQAARDRGETEGELAVPEDRLPPAGERYNRNQYVAWHGASQVYHAPLPGAPAQEGKSQQAKRRRVLITSDNWMLEHARSASQFNQRLSDARRQNFDGLYDIHTNSMQWPTGQEETGGDGTFAHRLPSVKAVYSRNFRIHDLWLEGPPDSQLGRPGYTVDETSLSSIPPHIVDELPAECAEALHTALQRESDWQARWRCESTDGLRAHFLPSIEWYPKVSGEWYAK